MKPHQQAKSFSDKGALRDHLERQHEGMYPKSRVNILVKSMYRPSDGNLFEECPMNCQSQPLTSESDRLAHHVATHLLSLAIEALPERSVASSQSKFPEYDDDQEEEVTDAHTRETAEKEMDSLPALDFESRIEIDGIPNQEERPKPEERRDLRLRVDLWLQSLLQPVPLEDSDKSEEEDNWLQSSGPHRCYYKSLHELDCEEGSG